MTPPCHSAHERPLCENSIGRGRGTQDLNEVPRRGVSLVVPDGIGEGVGATPSPMLPPVLARSMFSITRRREMLEGKIHLDGFTSH